MLFLDTWFYICISAIVLPGNQQPSPQSLQSGGNMVPGQPVIPNQANHMNVQSQGGQPQPMGQQPMRPGKQGMAHMGGRGGAGAGGPQMPMTPPQVMQQPNMSPQNMQQPQQQPGLHLMQQNIGAQQIQNAVQSRVMSQSVSSLILFSIFCVLPPPRGGGRRKDSPLSL